MLAFDGARPRSNNGSLRLSNGTPVPTSPGCVDVTVAAGVVAFDTAASRPAKPSMQQFFVSEMMQPIRSVGLSWVQIRLRAPVCGPPKAEPRRPTLFSRHVAISG